MRPAGWVRATSTPAPVTRTTTVTATRAEEAVRRSPRPPTAHPAVSAAQGPATTKAKATATAAATAGRGARVGIASGRSDRARPVGEDQCDDQEERRAARPTTSAAR